MDDNFLIGRCHVSRESLQALRSYEVLLHKWQKAINLVSPASLKESWSRHFIDSLQLLPLIDAGAQTVLDLGSGGGFPGMVIALSRSDLHVHLVDSDFRKCEFLKTVSRESSVGVAVHHCRVEALPDDVVPDIITARGFAPLSKLFEFLEAVINRCPALRFVLLKGENYQAEIDEALQVYQFEWKAIPSLTEPKAAVLLISNVSKLA